IFGLATAFVLVVCQLFCFQPYAKPTEVKKETQEEKQAEKSTAVISLPAPQTQQVSSQTVSDFALIEELVQQTKTKTERVKNTIVSAGKFFQTVFRYLISPNAP
ncbi:MAG: hypothetical protein ACK5X6_01075, partial [Chryseotalea sp.]